VWNLFFCLQYGTEGVYFFCLYSNLSTLIILNTNQLRYSNNKDTLFLFFLFTIYICKTNRHGEHKMWTSEIEYKHPIICFHNHNEWISRLFYSCQFKILMINIFNCIIIKTIKSWYFENTDQDKFNNILYDNIYLLFFSKKIWLNQNM
jgi:nitric oxide reductase large subunit